MSYPSDEAIIKRARELWERPSNDELEIDDQPALSRSRDDSGSWVAAWVWVNYEDVWNENRWEIQHETLCDGWVNTWTDGTTGKPVTFDTEQAAQAALDEYFKHIADAVQKGDMLPYDADEFRISRCERGIR